MGAILIGTTAACPVRYGSAFAVAELGAGAVVLLLPLAILLLVPPLIALARGKFNPLEPLYFCLLAYGLLYVAKPAVRLVQGGNFAYGHANFEWAVFVSVLGLVAFYIGYFCPLGPMVAAHVPPMSGEIHFGRLRRLAWIYILIGAAGLWIYMQNSGGWQAFW